jgi:2-C-methyl-D-erythritol 4-phosphate cytidylyltransferase
VGKVLDTAADKKAAILASPLIGTIKEVVDNTITNTVDRTRLYEAQTPQVFELTLLKKAYENLKNLDIAHISDDAQLVEALGKPVAVVASDPSNIKITYPSDVAIAEAIIKSRLKAKPEGPIGPYHEAQW